MLFLRAKPARDGGIPFAVTEGEPLPTSHGEDVYEKACGERPAVDDAA